MYHVFRQHEKRSDAWLWEGSFSEREVAQEIASRFAAEDESVAIRECDEFMGQSNVAYMNSVLSNMSFCRLGNG